MYLELCVKDQSKLTSHLKEKQELRLQSLIPITQKLSQINHDSEAYHKNCYETLKLLWRLKNNFHSKSRLTIAFEKWKNIHQVHHRGAKKLVAVLKHLNLKTAFASIRRDARDEGEIHKFMVTLNKLDSKLNRQKLISAFSQWRSSMFTISTEHKQEYKKMIVDIGGIVQNIHTQLYDKMEQSKMNYLQFNCKRQVFMTWRDFVKGHMALKKAKTLAAKAIVKSRRAFAIKKWRKVTRKNLERAKAVDQCTSKHKMLLLRKTLVSLRWFKDQNKFLRMTIERSLEIKNKTN